MGENGGLQHVTPGLPTDMHEIFQVVYIVQIRRLSLYGD